MKIQQEFLLLKNIGRFMSGQLITAITVTTKTGQTVALDLTKSPDWFKPMRSTWLPKKGDQYFYVDENCEVKSTVLADDIENLDTKSPDGKKLASGNFYEKTVQALNVASHLKEMHQLAQADLGKAQILEAEKNKEEAVQGGLG